jgi:hypothetical protein
MILQCAADYTSMARIAHLMYVYMWAVNPRAAWIGSRCRPYSSNRLANMTDSKVGQLNIRYYADSIDCTHACSYMALSRPYIFRFHWKTHTDINESASAFGGTRVNTDSYNEIAIRMRT